MAAREFCALIEARDAQPAAQWLAAAHALLPRLYAAALALPEVEPDTDGVDEREIGYEEWLTIYQDLTVRLGRWNYYWDVYDPYDEGDREPVCASLSDDLADIYCDLKNGLLMEAVSGGERPNDVLWSWRFSFTSHWAAHATGALRALQTAFFVHYVDQLPETFGDGPPSTVPPAP